MKRKLLSLILVVAMLASMAVFTPAASAAESKATLAFGNAAGVAGDEVTVDFEVTTESLQGIQFMFEYDSSRLEFVEFASAVDAKAYNVLTKELTAGTPAFTTTAPYLVYSWAEVNGAVLELSEGAVIATLTFAIKDDAPAGDAYVNFVPLAEGAVQPNKLSYGSTSIVAEEMTFVDGVVTVLPEGYASSATVADDAWDFEDGVIFGCKDETLADYTGALVIPSEINGETVVEIGAAAFDGYSFSTIVIPESVEFIAAGAIYNCSNLTKAYVLGAATELEEAAIGYEGSWRSGKLRNAAIILNDNDEVLTSIYGVAGSLAEGYANAGDGVDSFPFYAEVPYTVTFNGASYLVGAETKAPGVATIDGKTVIGWTAGDATYAAGATITLTESVVLEPVTITAPATSTVADFKLAASEADLAMRFTSSMSIADYEALAALGTVELGMLITPAAYVAKAGSFTKEALDGIGAANGAYVEVAVNGYYDKTETDYIFAGSLKGFSATTLAKNPAFASVLYATVTTAEGDTFTVYGTFNFAANQQVKAVAEAILDSNITNTQKGWLNTLIGKFGA